MDAVEQLKILTAQMHLEPAEDTGCPQIPASRKAGFPISHAALPNGKQIKLLKTLQTSACERNCYYCPFRAGRDFRRASLTPDEMAHAFDVLNRAGVVEGMFLSSGIVQGGVTTQDKLIATAEILRQKYHNPAYLHLKLMPGAEKAQVEAAMRLADRVSVNLEAPNTKRLELLAPKKQFLEELLQPLRYAQEIRLNQPGYLGFKGHWPSTVTQFVVGAVGESDLELLKTTEYIYGKLGLKRAYYSGFNPIEDTPFENLPPTPLIRQNRLYQASFLMRDYQFSMEELAFDLEGNLPLGMDPKQAWASQNLMGQPVELNRASREQLLRVPGIGPKGVEAVLKTRRETPLKEISQLKKLGVIAERAAPYILLNGKRPATQLAFKL
jgi:predicted DNA-binding helix-hairpin-helix protein